MNFKEFLFGTPIDKLLEDLANYGKTIKEKCDPRLYKHNEQNKVKHHRQNLDATRKTYAKIKNGLNARKALTELYLYVKDEEIKKLIEKAGH